MLKSVLKLIGNGKIVEFSNIVHFTPVIIISKSLTRTYFNFIMQKWVYDHLYNYILFFLIEIDISNKI